MLKNLKLYNLFLQGTILALTGALFWFAFVYYPQIIKDYKGGNVPLNSVFKPVSANSTNFPIETNVYRLVYEDGSQTYYAFVEGKSLDTYTFNQEQAILGLKTALSMQDLCGVKVIYVSTQELKIPENFQANGC